MSNDVQMGRRNARSEWRTSHQSAYRLTAHCMPLGFAQLQDRFRATIIGFAVGDALGFPLRGLPATTLSRQQALVQDFAPRPRGGFLKGQFSDDTQLMMATAHAIAREERVDGRTIAEHLSWLWQDGTILQPPPSVGRSMERFLQGVPWMAAGASIGVRDASCLSRGVVVGLWSEASPPRLSHDAQLVTVVTHKDPLCAAAVAAYARAIQLSVSGEIQTPQSFCDAVSAAAAPSSPELADELYYLPRVLNWEPLRALDALRRVGVPPSQLEMETGLPSHVTPVLLTAFFAVIKEQFDFRAAMSLALRVGGEVDVLSGLIASLVGGRSGLDAIPARLRKNVMYAEALTAAADALFDARVTRSKVVTQATLKR